MRNKWTRERIIRHIVEREAKGLPLTVGGDGIDLLMYEAARRIFGSWRNAVQAAGIAPRRVLTWERWSPAKILMMIRHLAQRKRPLTVVQMERRYGNMVSAARRHFGSWSKAVLAAGVDPTRLQRVVRWNRERVIEAILTRALRNESLVARLVAPRSLVDAAQRFFGSWAEAVTAAGLDVKVTVLPPRRTKEPRPARALAPRTRSPRKARQTWTKEMVIAAIHARLQDHKRINAASVDCEDHELYLAARRRFDIWSNTLLAAGLDPAEYRIAHRRKKQPATPSTGESLASESQGNNAPRPDRPA